MREKVYNSIVEYIEKNGYPPSYQEIGEIVGLKSKASVWNHIRKLVAEGKIETGIGKEPRAIKVIGYKFVKEK